MKEKNTLLYFLLFFSVLGGIYFRLIELGKWPLAVDEYYFTQSVLNLIEHGLPVFDCGGYYFRGVLQQYITGLVLIYSNDIEWAVRIVPVAANLLAIPAIYILGKRLGGTPLGGTPLGGHIVACTAVILFCFSLWEIEYARFARMYTPFQMVFLWQLVLLFQVVQDDKKNRIYYMYLIAALGLTVYEGAIFLVVLCALPLLIKPYYQNIKHILAVFALVVINVFYQTIRFRRIDAEPALPADIAGQMAQGATAKIPLELPDVILLQTLPGYASWLYGAAALFFISILILFFLVKTQKSNIIGTLSWIFLFICSFLNLYGLLILTAVFCIMLRLIKFEQIKSQRILQISTTALIINGVFWFAYGVSTDAWTQAFAGEEYNQYYKLLVVLLKYPDIYTPFIYQWMISMPWLTIFVFAFIAIGSLDFIFRSQKTTTFSVLVAVISVVAIIVGIMKAPYYTPRYTFFAYPVILLLFCVSLYQLCSFVIKKTNISLGVYFSGLLVFVIFAEDFNIYHLKNITSAEVNFRQIYDSKRAEVYYHRYDYSTPAVYVNDHMENNDLVISTVPVVALYLQHLDYRFVDYRIDKFPIVSACAGRKEIWSNANLLYKTDQLFNTIDNSSTPVWVIMNNKEHFKLNQEMKERYNTSEVYRGLDEKVLVYRLER